MPLQGKDAPRYLGSVEWGYEVKRADCEENDGEGNTKKFECEVVPLPFVVKSFNKASADMKRVIDAWNDGFYDYSDRQKPRLKNPQIPSLQL